VERAEGKLEAVSSAKVETGPSPIMGSLGEMEKTQGDPSSIRSSQYTSSQSDGEFWLDLETKPSPVAIPQGNSQFSTCIAEQDSSKATSFDLGVEILRKQGRRLSHLDPCEPLVMHIERSLSRLRKVKNSELANNSAVLKSAMVRQFAAKLQDLNSQHVRARYSQGEYVERLKEEVVVKSAEISHLRRLLEEQETLITALRTMGNRHVEEQEGPNSEHVENIRSEERRGTMGGLMVEIENVKTEMAVLAHNTEQYKAETKERTKECARLVSKVKAVKQELHRERLLHEAAKTELQTACEEQCRNLQQTLAEVRRQAALESRANEEIQTRLQGVIKDLQQELRTAKMVLTSPKLRDKVLTRLKDAKSLVEKSQSATHTVSPHSPLARNTTQTESRRRYRVSALNDSEMSDTMMVRAMSVSPHQQRIRRPL